MRNGYATFWGVKEVYHGICESRECILHVVCIGNHMISSVI